MAKSIVQPGSAVKKEAASALPVQAATPKEEARETFVGVRLTPKPEPAPAIIKPVTPAEPAAKPTLKDRPWQAGRLLSVAANTYFDGVPFTTDMDGGSWGFAQGKGGKMNVSVRAVSLPTNPFTFDSYM